MTSKTTYEYAKMTWPEVNDAVRAGRVAIIPTGMIEDHGPHLPIDTDVVIANAVCRRAAELVPDEVVVLPSVTFGYSPHHMDFPGAITIGWDTFIRYMLEVCKSLVAHGFRRILIVNGHGSNTPFVDIIARLTVVETGALAAAINYWNAPGVHEVAESLRESDLVDMSKAVREIGHQPTKNYWTDLVGGDGPLAMMEHWSSLSQTGVMGDPTKATAEKGERLLAAAANGLVEIINELRDRRTKPRVDHH